MEQSANAILEAAMMLSENDRITLASRLLESVPSDHVATFVDDPSLIEELDRRFADREGSIPWSDVAGGRIMPTRNVVFHRFAAREYCSAESGMRNARQRFRRFRMSVDRGMWSESLRNGNRCLVSRASIATSV